MSNPSPSGKVRPPRQIALTRRFHAPVADVWAAVTEPERLARWYGTWSGDSRSGEVTVTMTAESGHVGEPVRIRRCEPPHLLALTFVGMAEEWLLDLELSEADGWTELALVQTFATPEAVGDVGPGWEYYLDRLVAAEEGRDPDLLDFEADYYPAMRAYYEACARRLSTG